MQSMELEVQFWTLHDANLTPNLAACFEFLFLQQQSSKMVTLGDGEKGYTVRNVGSFSITFGYACAITFQSFSKLLF